MSMGFPAATVNETREVFAAIVRQVVSEARSDNLFPEYDLKVVTATLQTNTFQGMFQVARELIDQNVAMIVIPQRNVGLREYFISIVWGLRIPVVAPSCNLRTEVDYPCLSVALSGVSYMWGIDALRRLGFHRAVGMYNPNVFAQDVVEEIMQTSPDVQIRTLQVRTQPPDELVSRILAERETAIIAFSDQLAEFIPLVRQAVDPERARQFTFISAVSELQPANLPKFFPKAGDEDGVFDVTRAPFPFSSALYEAMAARENWAATGLNPNALRATVNGFGGLLYAPTKVWAHGFSELIRNASARDISANYSSRPAVNRPSYLKYFEQIGINGYVQTFSQNQFFIPQSWIRNFKLNANRTEITYSFLGTGTAAGLITNATFADGTNIRPPPILPLSMTHIYGSVVYYVAYCLAGLAIGWSLLLMSLLVAFRNRESVKSASWVFLSTTLTGTMLLGMVLFPTATDPTSAGCKATPILLSLAIHLILVSVSVKAFRLHLIFTNKLNKRIKLRDPQLAAIIISTYIPDIIMLSVWLTKDPVQPMPVEGGGVVAIRCVMNSGGFAWGLFAYGMLKLVVALRYTYLARDVYTKFNETKSVLLAVYNVMVGIAIAIASFAVNDLGREGQVILLLISLSTTSIGTASAITGFRLFFALTSGRHGAFKNPLTTTTSPTYPKPLGQMGSRGDSRLFTTSQGRAPWSDEPSRSAQGVAVSAKFYQGSIREKQFWFSPWASCCLNITPGGPLLICFVNNHCKGESGGHVLERFHGVKVEGIRYVRSLAPESANTAATQRHGAEVGASTFTYEVVFDSEAIANDFIKECEQLIINVEAWMEEDTEKKPKPRH
ncbi:hypothetical protein HK102_013364 [Quaeritorhiza haematococci]|nr:hypothetical protein HK102_013364 [Quaeritorhiza haematococci]